nr:haloacid dehalogenase [Chloroflexota bacterium]
MAQRQPSASSESTILFWLRGPKKKERDLERLGNITEQIQAYFEAKNATREQALTRSRELTRCCALAIRALHRAEYNKAADLLATAKAAAQRMSSDLRDHPDLYYSGYTQDALKEFAEATITWALLTDAPLPTPDELDVPPATYLNGLGEAMGEVRRYVLDVIRRGEIDRCEAMLQVMEEVYSTLVTIDYPDVITGGLRRTTDMVRGVLERTRGDLTMAARQEALRSALRDFESTLRQAEYPLEKEPAAGADNG